jgi:hypothetical protein
MHSRRERHDLVMAEKNEEPFAAYASLTKDMLLTGDGKSLVTAATIRIH